MITREELKTASEVMLKGEDAFLRGIYTGFGLRLIWVDKKIERLTYRGDLPQAINKLPATEEEAKALIPEIAYDEFYSRLKQICEANGIDIQGNRIISPKLYSKLVRRFGPKEILDRAGIIYPDGRLVDCNRIQFEIS